MSLIIVVMNVKKKKKKKMDQWSFRDINKNFRFDNHGLPHPPRKSDCSACTARRGHSVAKFRRLSGYYMSHRA